MGDNYLSMAGWGGLNKNLTQPVSPIATSGLRNYGTFENFADVNGGFGASSGVQPPAAGTGWFNREAMFGGPNSAGWAPTLLSFGQAAMGFANSRAQNRLAKENFARYKAESNLNIENQAKGINENLETRQARRVRERFGNLSEAEQAGKVAEYMAKWGVKDKING